MKYQVWKVSYIPGKLLYREDTISRVYLAYETGGPQEIIVMASSVQIRDVKRQALAQAYEQDPVLPRLQVTIMKDWNWCTKRQVPVDLHTYWDMRDKLYIQDGFIYRSEQILVPASLLKEWLNIL